MARHWWKDGQIVWDRCEACDEDEVDGGTCRYCGKEQTIPDEKVTSPDGPGEGFEAIRADLREIMNQ